MMDVKNKALLGAAVAGILTGVMALTSSASDKKHMKGGDKTNLEACYGINSCKGNGQCGGKASSCAGTNGCKGQGWINVEKGHCKDVQGGSTSPLPEKKS